MSPQLRLTVDTLIDENDGDLSAGDLSLREALAEIANGGIIEFDPTLAAANAGAGNGTIGLTLGELVIDKSITINGLEAQALTISAQGTSRVFNIDDGTTEQQAVTLNRVTLADGVATEGGGILTQENLTLQNSTITGNREGIFVGPAERTYIYEQEDLDQTVTVINSTLSANDGSGIRGSGTLVVTGSTVEGNSGNGIEFTGRIKLNDSRLSGNGIDGITNNNSIAILFSGGPPTAAGANYLDIANTTISNNGGSGISGDTEGGFSLTIADSTISGNTTAGILDKNTFYGSFITLNNTAIEGNGSGIISADYYSIVTIENSSISGNTAAGITAAGGVTLNDSRVKNNQGGGILSSLGETDYSPSVNIRSSIIEGNREVGISGTNVFVTDSTIRANLGDGILIPVQTRFGRQSTEVFVDSSNISDNQGVGIKSAAREARVDSSTLANNAGGGVSIQGVPLSRGSEPPYYVAQFSVQNSTIVGNGSANSDVGGLFVSAVPSRFLSNGEGYANTLSVENSTIVRNRGAIAGGILAEENNRREGTDESGSNLTLANSIVANNTGTMPDISGTVDSQGYNLIGDGTDITGLNGPGDIVGTQTNPIDPQLGPLLQDNGGPTLTLALQPNSPAIDAGNPNFNGATDFDQRGDGFSRVIDGDGDGRARLDIGAFEAAATAEPPRPNKIVGTRRSDRLQGTQQNDIIRGRRAADSLNGKGGDDRLFGDAGNDRLLGSSGDDELTGGKGADLLRGGQGKDAFVYKTLGDGNDTILDFMRGEDRIDLSRILSDTRYNSATPFEDYVRIGQANRLDAQVSILDLNRSRDGRLIFRDLAIIKRVEGGSLDESSFVL